jgi:hypothetical protein
MLAVKFRPHLLLAYKLAITNKRIVAHDTRGILKYFRAQVKKYRHQYSLNEGKAFGLWYASDSLGLEDDEAYEAVSFDGANDKDIDFFFVDQEAERVLIGQLKFNGLGKYKGKKSELLSLIHTTDWLKDPESLARTGRKDIRRARLVAYTLAVTPP